MKLSKSLVFNTLLALLVAVILFSLSQEGFLKDVELSGLDLSFRLRGALPFNPKIIIIEITDYDIQKIGRWPWDRAWHAAITKALSDFGAKVIYFDIIFSEASSEESDALFEDAIKKTKKVYLPFAFQLPSRKMRDAILPLKRFSGYIKGTGAVNIYPDPDGTLRKIPLVFFENNNVYSHAALRIARDYMGFNTQAASENEIILSGAKEKIEIPLTGNGQMLINWAGKWQKTFKHYSFLDILSAYKDLKDNKKPAIDINDFKDSICMVGITALGLYDIKPVPLQPEYPGIGIFANTVNNILNRNFIRDAPLWANTVVLFLLVLIPAFLIFGERPLREALFALLTGFVYFGFSLILFVNGLRMNFVIPIMGLFLSYSTVSIYNFVRISVERQSFFHLSVTDGLTGLYNIRYFKMLLETEILLAGSDTDKKFAIIMSDIDHFKNFNDSYGHQIGDLVLKSVAMVMKSSVRTLDIVARYGGEEMIILLRGASLGDGVHVAEKIKKNVENCMVKEGDKSYKVTVSFGVSEFKRGDAVDAVIKRADDGLYKAKQSGRNRVAVADVA